MTFTKLKEDNYDMCAKPRTGMGNDGILMPISQFGLNNLFISTHYNDITFSFTHESLVVLCTVLEKGIVIILSLRLHHGSRFAQCIQLNS